MTLTFEHMLIVQQQEKIQIDRRGAFSLFKNQNRLLFKENINFWHTSITVTKKLPSLNPSYATYPLNSSLLDMVQQVYQMLSH